MLSFQHILHWETSILHTAFCTSMNALRYHLNCVWAVLVLIYKKKKQSPLREIADAVFGAIMLVQHRHCQTPALLMRAGARCPSLPPSTSLSLPRSASCEFWCRWMKHVGVRLIQLFPLLLSLSIPPTLAISLFLSSLRLSFIFSLPSTDAAAVFADEKHTYTRTKKI